MSGHFEGIATAHSIGSSQNPRTSQAGVSNYLSLKLRASLCTSDEDKKCGNANDAAIQACKGGKYLESPTDFDSLPTCTCRDCALGTYSTPDVFCIRECVECPLGTAAGTTGLSECTRCLAGTYGDEDKLTECKTCVAGKFSSPTPPSDSPTVGYSECSVCAAGFASGPRASECTVCTAGQMMTSTTSSGTPAVTLRKCEACPANTYQTTAGSTSCLDCPTGSRHNAAHTGCECSAGFEWADGSCRPCGPGTYSLEHSNKCEPCASGYYQSASSASSCLQCTGGDVSQSGTVCTCPAGTEWTGTLCRDCLVGKYSAGGANKCEPCATGTYQDQAKQGTCKRCSGTVENLGTYCACSVGYGFDSSTQDCVPCAPGFFGAQGTRTCTPCPADQYQDQSLSSSCKVCDGTVGSGSTSCACGNGFQMSATTSKCEKCLPGSAGTRGTCLDCPTGTYQNELGAFSCRTCSGTVAEGRTSCICGPGTGWSTVTKNCVECAAGTSSTGGVNVCTSCMSGYYQPDKHASACISCNGEVSVTRTSCSCLSGHRMDTIAKTCVACSAGKYSSGKNMECQSCELGKYQNLEGAASCMDCNGEVSEGGTKCVETPEKKGLEWWKILLIVLGCVIGVIAIGAAFKKFYWDKRNNQIRPAKGNQVTEKVLTDTLEHKTDNPVYSAPSPPHAAAFTTPHRRHNALPPIGMESGIPTERKTKVHSESYIHSRKFFGVIPGNSNRI